VEPFANLVELGEYSGRRYGDRELFGTKDAAGWRWMHYREFQEQVDAFRAGLAGLGVGRGDRVAIVSNNRIEWAVAAYATYGLEACFVPMYEAQSPEEWQFILHDCEARAVVGSERALGGLEAIRANVPSLQHVIKLDRSKQEPESFAALLDVGRARPVVSRRPAGDALAGLIYTSGTTGRPKGVMLTHHNLTSNVAAATAIFPVVCDDRSLSFLPWAHAYGQVVELHILLSCGASTAFNSDLSRLLDELAEVRPTLLVAVPKVFNKIYASVNAQMSKKPRPIRALFDAAIRHAARKSRGEQLGAVAALELALADRLIFGKIRDKLGGRLRYAITAAATMNAEVAEFIDALGVPVYEGYGLTETSPVVSANYPGARRMGSVGKPLPGVRVSIDESRGDHPGHGEIVVHGPNVMKGYYHRPREQEAVLIPAGGLRTGDLGRVDADGFLWVTGRIKEQYKLENGKYVMPSVIEEALKLSPYIANVMLYGDGRPYNAALVVLDVQATRAWARASGRELADDITRDHEVRQLVAREIEERSARFRAFERPRAFELILEDFTSENGLLTPTLKLKRVKVLEKHRDALERPYASTRGARAA
jgi:long-chain acyl-CoA synthetase